MSGNLCGYVVRNGTPVPDAAISVVEGPGQYPDLAPLSDASGWFALDRLQPGLWRVSALAPDGGSGEASFEIWDNSLSEVTIELGQAPQGAGQGQWSAFDPSNSAGQLNAQNPINATPDNQSISGDGQRSDAGRIVGRVSDIITGEPIADVHISAIEGPSSLGGETRTDSAGGFAIADLSPGDWVLRIDLDAERSADLAVTVPPHAGSNVDIQISARGLQLRRSDSSS